MSTNADRMTGKIGGTLILLVQAHMLEHVLEHHVRPFFGGSYCL